ncbi:unnamed protein product [Amoebophrya sp. A120]|nr:unnamed protein product [Amoebophrya sp. A120]|eukprot:GSA120T00018124001.1
MPKPVLHNRSSHLLQAASLGKGVESSSIKKYLSCVSSLPSIDKAAIALPAVVVEKRFGAFLYLPRAASSLATIHTCVHGLPAPVQLLERQETTARGTVFRFPRCIFVNTAKQHTITTRSRFFTTMPTIFDKILDKEIPSEKVYEDDQVYAFKDISPQAPVHVLVIPKVRDIPRISEAREDHKAVLGHLFYVAGKIGRELCGEKGFRIAVNDGDNGGQTVYHLHLHVLGNRPMTWPPG